MRPLRPLEPAHDWQTAIAAFCSDRFPQKCPAVMVCGPKNSGKSTFCRLLANALLAKAASRQKSTSAGPRMVPVAYLDLDPGQPEYSPPGELSLRYLRTANLGPSFTHPKVYGNDNLQAGKAHHFGYLSPKEDPEFYYKCAVDLMYQYKNDRIEEALTPLIVNCSGWVQGGGLDLLTKLIQHLDLTDVIYTSTSGPDDTIQQLLEATTGAECKFHQLPSQGSETITKTAADLRMMQTLSYFHLDEPEFGNLRWNPSPLASIPPLVVHFAGPKQAITAVSVLGDEQDPDFLGTILNGCIVGLVVVGNTGLEILDKSANGQEADDTDYDVNIDDNVSEIQDLTQEEPHNPIQRNDMGIPYITSRNGTIPPPIPTYSHSLGQALIRGIDPINKAFHILTPLPPSTFQTILETPDKNIILVRGKLDTPTWAYCEQHEYQKAMGRRREDILQVKEEGLEDSMKRMVEQQPWMEIAEDGGRKGSGKVRRVRRDLRYKP